jgi:RND family efflux transporter MFP subunit
MLRRYLTALMLLAAVLPARAADGPPVSVTSAPVTLVAAPQEERALGKVDSLGKTTLSAPVTGEIVGPFQTEGEVTAGTVIARNVPPALQSSITRARTDVALARAAYARTRQLASHQLSTQLALIQARRNLARATANLDGLRQEAAQQVIKAPLAGTLHYLISPGTVVYKGTPIATISGRATPWIDLRVPPKDARQVSVGARAQIAAAGWSGTGRVISVGRDARLLGLVRVRVGLPVGNPLVPGQWVWVQVTRSGRPTPSVPAGALVMRGGRTMVFVLQGGRARAVFVHVLTESGRRAWLAGPLRAGEQVAVTHAARLAEGSRVHILSDPSPGPAR